MRACAIAVALIATVPMLGACTTDERGARPGYNSRGDHYRGGGYDRNGAYNGNSHRYRRHLGDNDTIYRDRNGHYYCKRDDGTTGTIVGALAGGVLGNVIAPGGSKTLGTIIGAVGGGVAGRAIDRNDVGCE
jgi:outer membrane lipoprotein SlyB